jgi:hypothetical protein
MPKESSRGQLGDAIEEETGTESSPVSVRMMTQTSLSSLPRGGTERRLSGDGDEGAVRPGMGVKQSSMSSLPRQTSFDSGGRPKHPSRPQRRCVSGISLMPRRSTRTLFSKNEMDEKTDTLSRTPRLVKQRSYTGARLASLESLTGDEADVVPNGTNRRQRMVRRNSLTMSRHSARSLGSKNGIDEKTDTLPRIPRLERQRSCTGARLSSRGILLEDEANVVRNVTDRRQQMAKQNSLTMPRYSTRSLDSKNEMDEKTDFLSSMPRVVRQRSCTGTRLSSRGSLIEDDGDDGSDGIAVFGPSLVAAIAAASPTEGSPAPEVAVDDKGIETSSSDRRQLMARQNSLSSTLRLVEQAIHL